MRKFYLILLFFITAFVFNLTPLECIADDSIPGLNHLMLDSDGRFPEQWYGLIKKGDELQSVFCNDQTSYAGGTILVQHDSIVVSDLMSSDDYMYKKIIKTDSGLIFLTSRRGSSDIIKFIYNERNGGSDSVGIWILPDSRKYYYTCDKGSFQPVFMDCSNR